VDRPIALELTALGIRSGISQEAQYHPAVGGLISKTVQKEKIMSTRPPLPPFTRDTAIQKVRLAEDSWNSRDPEKVALAYTPDSQWRNRSEFVRGRQEIVAFLCARNAARHPMP